MNKEKNSPSVDSFKVKCKEHRLKTTPQRLAIYKELLRSDDHPHADIVFKKVRKIFPHISFDTINRTLLTFAELGIVAMVEGYGEPKRFDIKTDQHHHFRCIKCKDIVDFYHTSYDNIKVPENLQRQYTILAKRVVLEGICDKCGKKS
jgi:Fur family transcriptional regulator, peroxide stress response regulator